MISPSAAVSLKSTSSFELIQGLPRLQVHLLRQIIIPGCTQPSGSEKRLKAALQCDKRLDHFRPRHLHHIKSLHDGKRTFCSLQQALIWGKPTRHKRSGSPAGEIKLEVLIESSTACGKHHFNNYFLTPPRPLINCARLAARNMPGNPDRNNTSHCLNPSSPNLSSVDRNHYNVSRGKNDHRTCHGDTHPLEHFDRYSSITYARSWLSLHAAAHPVQRGAA